MNIWRAHGKKEYYIIILNSLNSPYWCDYQPFFFNNSTLLLISWNLALKLLLTQLVILFDTIMILARSCCAPRRTTSASKNSSADYGNFKLKVGQVFWRLTSWDFLRSEDDISEIHHQIIVLHPPQKKGNFYILLPKIASTLYLAHFTHFKGKNPRDGQKRGGFTPKHHHPPKSCQASARHHHAILWKCLTTHQGGAFSWGTAPWRSILDGVFVEPNGNSLYVGNLIYHLILHPHPIYEQSISTNSFPASNTA